VKQNCTILHLEDDDNDSLLFKRALTQLQFTGQYHRISSVQEAIAYLSGSEDFADREVYPIPQILVADGALGSGHTTGELTEWLNQQKEFGDLIRVVFSGNVNPADQQKWLDCGARCVLSKGANLHDFTVAVKEIIRRCG
jgi:CheY-like chemotaxis protein